MLTKKHLNRNLVVFLYGLIIANVLLFMIETITSFGYVLYISSVLILLIIALTPLTIIYTCYIVLKAFNIKNLLYCILSFLSTLWIFAALYYAAYIMSNF
jgi:hypothetical protein